MQNLKCFSGGTIIDPLESLNKFDAIDELLHKAPVFQSEVEDLDDLEDAVIAREKFQSTGFGHGIAVAHGKSPQMKSIYIALGISRRGIDFDSLDGRPVHLLFLIASPPRLQQEYLQALSVLISLVRDPDFRMRLLGMRNINEMEELLQKSFGTMYKARKEKNENLQEALADNYRSLKSKVAK